VRVRLTGRVGRRGPEAGRQGGCPWLPERAARPPVNSIMQTARTGELCDSLKNAPDGQDHEMAGSGAAGMQIRAAVTISETLP
jgi:hypothetical protein